MAMHTGSMTRRRLLGALGAAGVAGLVAACGGGGQAQLPTAKPAGSGSTPAAGGTAPAAGTTPAAAGATPATGAAAQPTAPAPAKSSAGTMAVWQVKLFTEAANTLSRKNITDFATAQGGKVEISDLPTDFIAKLIPAIEAGDVPDVVQTTTELPQLQAANGLADVTPIVNELTGPNGAPLKLLERAGLIGGKWYGVPWFHYADAWFLRRDLITAGGLKPEDLKTFDQRRDAALQLSKPDAWGWGLTMKSNTGDGDALARLAFDSWGGSLTGEDGLKVIVGTTNKEAAVKAIEWMVDVYTNPRFAAMLPPGVMGWTGASNNENYLAGKLVMTQNASSVYWAAKNQNSPYFKETYVAPLAAGPAKSLNGGYPYYHVVMAKAKNMELAMKTAKHMSEDAQVFERVKIAEGQSWPAFQKQADSPTVQEFVKTDPGYAQLLKNATDPSGWTVGYPGPLTPAAAAVNSQFLFARAFESAIAKQVTPTQAVEELQKAAVEIFNSFGFRQ